ncbi:hypothetical protein BFW01_g9976 [Lasiodiplodia theobromae]|nr:hypothetical protein BFW01_g9976 [Lasiodiplodia theobromae]
MDTLFRRGRLPSDEQIPLTPVNAAESGREPHQVAKGHGGPLSGTPLFASYTRQSAEDFNKISQLDQNANAPIFIPSLVNLRRRCFEHVSSSLLELERDIPRMEHNEEKINKAIELLKDMDAMVESEAKRLRMEDPEYAASRGLSIVHFESKDPINTFHQGNWLMLSKKWGYSASNIVDPINKPDGTKLSKYHLKHIKDFMGVGLEGLHMWTRRTKTVEERQRGSLKYQVSGETELNYRIARTWKIVLYLAVAALILFYGVGIIATNSQFSPTFEQFFFWIAIFWSLISSALLSWVVKVLGGSHRDVVAAMLTGIGIWLVVIQIGQTRLNRQLEDRNNSPNRSE